MVDGVCVFDTTTSYTTSQRPSPTGMAETTSLVCVGVPTTTNPAGSQLIVGSTPESAGTSASAHAVFTTESATGSVSSISNSWLSVAPGARDSIVNDPSSGCRSSETATLVSVP
ncbi:Uncharacterised protein [Mycobacteroides abscessus]|nr:Uncharacterised protein [Mycobacteroides abscessus]